MSLKYRPPVSHFLELGACLIVLAGLAQLAKTFIVLGYLPAPFVFDVGDTFMDWFNTAYWAHNPGAYSVWRTIYLPLSFVITGLLGDPLCYGRGVHPYDARNCDVLGIVVILLTYVACVIVTGIALRRKDRSTALLRTVVIAVGGPMLFALERGNLIMIAYIAFVLLYGGLLKSKGAMAFASAFLINMKVYLVFPVLAFAVKRRWRLLELSGFAAIALYLITLLIVGSGTPLELASNLDNWFNVRLGTIWDEVLFSTTYKPYLLFDERQYPVRDFVLAQWIDLAKVFVQYEVIASRGIALLCIAGAWFYPRAVTLQRLVFFILMQSFIVQNPGGYAITMVVFLVFMEKWSNWRIGLGILCCYLVSIPADINITVFYEYGRQSWLSGRDVTSPYALPLGALIRPGLLMILLWSLAIDTLINLHRAVKAGPPSIGLSPRQTPASQTGPNPSPAYPVA